MEMKREALLKDEDENKNPQLRERSALAGSTVSDAPKKRWKTSNAMCRDAPAWCMSRRKRIFDAEW